MDARFAPDIREGFIDRLIIKAFDAEGTADLILRDSREQLPDNPDLSTVGLYQRTF